MPLLDDVSHGLIEKLNEFTDSCGMWGLLCEDEMEDEGHNEEGGEYVLATVRKQRLSELGLIRCVGRSTGGLVELWELTRRGHAYLRLTERKGRP
jgi:hypothetical protein